MAQEIVVFEGPTTMVEPKKAAACIILRNPDDPEVLMARRNDALRFMGGHHVFPGGRISDAEPTERVVGASDRATAAAIHAVAREVFEETGLLGVREKLPHPDVAAQARRATLDDEQHFDRFLDAHGLHIHAADFEPAGDWTTPVFSPIRFQTRYFLYWLPEGRRENLIPGEIVALDWMRPGDARRRWHLGEVHISTPVAFALHQLDAVSYPRVLEFLHRACERSPGVHNRFEIRRGISVVPLESRTLPPATHTNCVIVGEKDVFVIDPGAESPREQRHLHEQLEHYQDLGARIQAVLLTHSHPDHVAAAAYVRDQFDAPVWAHPAVREQVSFEIDREIEHDELLISAGDPQWRLRAIHTPGHDPGHLCFLEESTGVLICGDMIANPGTIVVSKEYGGDMDAFISSLERLMELPSKVALPAHGHPVGKPHEKFREHRDHRLWRERKIRHAVEEGLSGIDQLLARAYDDVPREAWPLARHSLLSHLDRLGVSVEG